MALRTAETAVAARARIRAGEHTGPTSGLAPGFAQANLVILPADDALDFLRFCVRNPKPCPLLEVTDTGSPHPDGSRVRRRPAHRPAPLPRLSRRTARRRADGRAHYWRADLVSFLLGCSFTFEWALDRCRPAGRASAPGRQRPDVRHEPTLQWPPARSTGRWWCRCGRSHPTPSPTSSRSPLAFPPCTAPRCTSATRPQLGIADLAAPDFGDPVQRRRRRGTRLLGVRSDAAGRRARGTALAGDLPRTRTHVHHRSTPRRLRLSGEVMTIHEAPDRHRDADPAAVRKAVRGAAIGNTVEWYDFAIYSTLATYIADKFFPSGDETAALLSTFAVFAAAFFMRPLGGFFFGPLGDRIGRQRVLASGHPADVGLDLRHRPGAQLRVHRRRRTAAAAASALRAGILSRWRIRQRRMLLGRVRAGQATVASSCPSWCGRSSSASCWAR